MVIWGSVRPSRCTVFKECGVRIDWDEAQPVRKDFIMNDGGVIPDVDVFYSDGRYLRVQ